MPPVDCFIIGKHDRPYLERLTYTALKEQGLQPKFVERKIPDAYVECERRANTPIYVIAEDATIPSTKDTIEKAVQLLEFNPEFSQIGLSDVTIRTTPGKNSDIIESSMESNCVIVRKGAVGKVGLTRKLWCYNIGV